jgi:hypothetical protein
MKLEDARLVSATEAALREVHSNGAGLRRARIIPENLTRGQVFSNFQQALSPQQGNPGS